MFSNPGLPDSKIWNWTILFWCTGHIPSRTHKDKVSLFSALVKVKRQRRSLGMIVGQHRKLSLSSIFWNWWFITKHLPQATLTKVLTPQNQEITHSNMNTPPPHPNGQSLNRRSIVYKEASLLTVKFLFLNIWLFNSNAHICCPDLLSLAIFAKWIDVLLEGPHRLPA